MSGTIYIKQDPDVIINKIKNNEIDLSKRLSSMDYRILSKMGELRDIIIDKNIHRDVQSVLTDTKRFTLEEAMRVIRASECIISSLSSSTYYTYPAEFLVEFGYKMDLYNIESQPNITTEFVEKYGHKMDLPSFLEVRHEKGDADIFKELGVVRIMDVPQNAFNYRMSLEEIINKYKRYKNLTEEDIKKISSTVNDLHSIKITKEYIRDLYNTGEGNHSTHDIMNYWDNHYRPNNIEFNNWQEFVAYSNRNSCSALPDVVFDAFYRNKIRTAII